ncbi:hypothetical protein [uncultured Bacteroides sp.]|jgi:4'-phosphopantetheinyl transferase|uniref:hypothetical protein n=1 Tax=uncultured Bacteroides sp. TaxID=162156 RepID=UPI00280BC2C7|nr:hypothetical protein [uncultured Bacteroides sp.]
MPLLKKWECDGGTFAVWQVLEQAGELRSMLLSSLPYDSELACLRADSRKMEYLAVRVLLKHLCGGEEKRIGHYPSGRPYLDDRSFSVSISHTRGYVAVGIHPTDRVGIDIEYFSDRVNKIVPRFIRDDEPAPTVCQRLLHWSAKETMYKLMDEPEVDFKEHLRILPFPLHDEGMMRASEFRTPWHYAFGIHYWVHPDFVCTWSVLSR